MAIFVSPLKDMATILLSLYEEMAAILVPQTYPLEIESILMRQLSFILARSLIKCVKTTVDFFKDVFFVA